MNDTQQPAARFYARQHELPDLAVPREPSALERLGPAPFPKGRFPFLGFLATVYDHISAHAQRRLSGSNDR
jgi:hypothetical protein